MNVKTKTRGRRKADRAFKASKCVMWLTAKNTHHVYQSHHLGNASMKFFSLIHSHFDWNWNFKSLFKDEVLCLAGERKTGKESDAETYTIPLKLILFISCARNRFLYLWSLYFLQGNFSCISATFCNVTFNEKMMRFTCIRYWKFLGSARFWE